MANEAQCAFCFETLAADLENRESLNYSHVFDLWSRYEALNNPMQVQTLGDGLDGMSSIKAGKEEEGNANGLEEEIEEGEAEQTVQLQPRSSGGGIRLPSISRLQAPSPASGCSSSSTTSSASASSSAAALGGNSKSSSSSSFFSFGRSKQVSPVVAPKEEEHPLFVTWNTVSARSGHKSLRGCIGTFEALEISSGLRSYALTAAFDDTRFPPISLSELRSLSNSITLLTGFTSCSHPFDWDIGTHGIRISFTHHGKRYGATYLPDVALEQGWTKEETLISLMQKAGWRGRRGEWRDVKSLNVVRYEGQKASLGYPEWKTWREWVKTL